MSVVEHEDMVEAFSAEGADEPLAEGVLPGGPRRGEGVVAENPIRTKGPELRRVRQVRSGRVELALGRPRGGEVAVPGTAGACPREPGVALDVGGLARSPAPASPCSTSESESTSMRPKQRREPCSDLVSWLKARQERGK